MKRAEALRLQDAKRLESGVSRLDYLTDNIYTKMMTQYETDNPLADFGIARKSFRVEAEKIAKQRLPSYETMMDTANNFGSFEDFEEDYAKASGIPRSIFGWMTSGVKNIVKGETEESLEYKAKKQKDALYGTGLFDKFTNLEKSYAEYDQTSSVPLDLVGILKQAEDDNLIKGKMIESQVQISTTKQFSRGTETTTNHLIIPRYNIEDGSIDMTSKVISKIVSQDKDAYLDADAITKITDQVKDEYKGNVIKLLYTKGDPYIENADTALVYINSNPQILAINWNDQKNIGEAFENWYSIQIKHAGFINDDGEFQSISEKNLATGEWEIMDDYRPKATELGLDEVTAFEQFSKMGGNYQLLNKNYNSLSDAITFDKLQKDGYIDITTNLTKEQKTEYNAVLQGDWYDVFKIQIDAGKTLYEADPKKNPRMTLLSDSFDFSKAFGLDFFDGNYSIYRDNETDNIFVKPK